MLKNIDENFQKTNKWEATTYIKNRDGNLIRNGKKSKEVE